MKGGCLDPTLSTRVILVTLVHLGSHLSSLYHSRGSHLQPCCLTSPLVAIGFPGLQQFSLGQSHRPIMASTIMVNEILCNRLTPTLAPKARLHTS